MIKNSVLSFLSHSGTYPYSPYMYMAVPPPPRAHSQAIIIPLSHHLLVSSSCTSRLVHAPTLMPVEEAAISFRSISTAPSIWQVRARARLPRTRARQMSAEKNVDILGWYDNLPKHPKSDYAPITRIRKGEHLSITICSLSAVCTNDTNCRAQNRQKL